MNQHHVTQLGYLGIGVGDMSAWERFAGDLLGLQCNGHAADGTLFMKMDARHHRLAIHPGGSDDIAYAGWEVRDEAESRALAEQLARHGGRVVAWGSSDEVQARRVQGLLRVLDPNGVTHEVYWGPSNENEVPFRSPRPIGGFETGALGFGHIVLAVDDYEQSLHFYRDGLGLKLSDFIELDMGDAGHNTVAFFHAGPRHHSLAIAQYPAARRLHHFMLQVRDLDDVGSTYDLCQDRGIPIAASLGRHTNDRMTSFYMQSPSGFQVEFGHGGIEIDDHHWQVQTYHAASNWGHRAPTATALPANVQPR